MGLDMVEFVMETEETFNLKIPDQEAEKIMTPCHLINYILDRVPAAETGPCLSQRAFYRLRKTVARVLEISPRSLRPTTSLLDLLPEEQLKPCWKKIGQEIGIRPWPRIGRPRWFDALMIRPRLDLLGEVAHHLVTHSLWTFKDREEGWTRHQISEVVHGFIEQNFGLKRGEYNDNTPFVKFT